MRHEDIWDKQPPTTTTRRHRHVRAGAPRPHGRAAGRTGRRRTDAGARDRDRACRGPAEQTRRAGRGIEIAPAMVEQLREKVDAATMPVVIGDMTTATVPGEFSLAFFVFDGISNVLTQVEQIACFRCRATSHAGSQVRDGALGARASEEPPAAQVIVGRVEPGTDRRHLRRGGPAPWCRTTSGFSDTTPLPLHSPHRWSPAELDHRAASPASTRADAPTGAAHHSQTCRSRIFSLSPEVSRLESADTSTIDRFT